MRRLLIPVLFLVLGAAAFLGLRATRPEPAEVAPQERSWRVETLSVALSSHAPLLPLYGEIVAPEAVTFTAPLPARIAERPVRDGQRVAEDQLLVALDEADVAPVVARAEARVNDLEAQIEAERVRQESDRTALARERELLGNARRRLERVRSLSERNLASASSLDDARDALAQARVTVDAREGALAGYPARLAQLEAGLAEARAGLDEARRDAERSRVEAPFAGIVSGVAVAPGERVGEGAELLSIYPRDGLELRAQVPSAYLDELQVALDDGRHPHAVGERARFRLEGFVGESAPGGTEAILRLEGMPRALRPGSLVDVMLRRPPVADSLAVPASALYGDEVLYLRDEDDRMRRLRIERHGPVAGDARGDGAATNDGWVLVSGAGLADGQEVIVTHLPNAAEGLKLQVVGDEEDE
ncbi:MULTISPECIES: efflux RND transporter periplasmic adaptor subunit [Halomonas]|uniref:NolF secretion protein n=1 Tax=Halomonas halophila TaxID=29573 RepID=A0ABQ0U274_9GAMM|nr:MULTISPECIES: HlyD family efflux transporter periplasmic adaptor subunit [Halomonas]MDR5888345.1 HlyD family efflux transporter periplasmic adaptor subunit [Halomonas salina]WJY08855.1 HlyD family efflux transporter periplasmic adaptor subunit [Halomonas halophila]GEK71788.1 nolF secretion protein [Halomonas halophila]